MVANRSNLHFYENGIYNFRVLQPLVIRCVIYYFGFKNPLSCRPNEMNYDTGGYGKLADIIIEKGIEEGFIDEDDLD